MKIVCEECSSKYSVDDSKVQNKSFKITCKKCGNKIIIDNTKKEEDVTSSDPFASQTNWDDDMPAGMGADMDFDDQATKIMSYDDAMKMDATKQSQDNDSVFTTGSEMDFDDEATKIMSSSEAANLAASSGAGMMQQPEEDWYVHINGQQVGPLSLSQLQAKIKQEKLPETSNVWKTGMPDWSMIKNIPELASHVVKAPPADPFGGMNSNAGAFGNDSLLDDNDAESLFNDKQEQSNASSFSNNNAQSNPFADSSSNSGGGGFGGGLDLKSLIDQEDLEEDEDDDSSKSKVIDFRDIQGNNNKKIVVQHASFNAATNNSSGGGKGALIAIVAVLVLALGGAGVYFGVIKEDKPVVKQEKLTKIFISSTPSDALIKLNGELKGKTGGNLIEVKPGSYQLKLIKDGYESAEDVIVVKKEDFIKKYTLKPSLKEVTIKTGLVEADITVGTQKLKTNPNGEATLKMIPASNVVVKVEKDGATKISTMINVTAEGDANFDLSALATETPKENTASAKTTTKTTRKTTRRTPRKTTRTTPKTTTKTKKSDDLDDLLGGSAPVKKKPVASNLPKTLTQPQVLKVIKKVYPKVKTCGKNAGISGKLMVKFRINGSGSVSGIKVPSNAGAAKNCVYSKVRSMRFPRFSGSAIPVTFPFKM